MKPKSHTNIDISFKELTKTLQSYARIPHYDLGLTATGRKRSQTFEGFCIVIRTLSGLDKVKDRTTVGTLALQLEQGNVQYQVLVCLYDITYRQFFGRQWKGPVVAPRGNKLQYNKSLYFHTSINNINVVAVIEVVAHTIDTDGRPHRVSCGWGFMRPFNHEGDLPDSSRGIQPTTQKIPLYHGTPRALYFLEDPIENNPLLTTIEECQLSCSVMSQKSLLGIMHLLPDNTLVDSHDIVPGMVDAPGSDRFKTPGLLNQVPIVIDGLNIRLHPNVDKFEAELCELMNEDKSLRENRQLDTAQVSIVERRLQVGVHNGWCYIEKPNVFQLEKVSGNESKKPAASPTIRRSSRYHTRRNSTGSSVTLNSGHAILVLKNKIEIRELLEDPLCSVVFTLEYVIGEPLSAQERKQTHSLTRAYTRTVHVRWTTWTPFLHPNTQDVTMALVGGPLRSPDDALVYKIPTTSMQDENTAVAAGGLLAFRWARDGEAISAGPMTLAVPAYPAIGSAISLRSDVSEGMMYETGASGDPVHRKPPQWKNSQHRQSVFSTRSHHSLGGAFSDMPGFLPNRLARTIVYCLLWSESNLEVMLL